MTQPLEWLNYHHLLYFWMVAREGTIAQAATKLHLTHPTISTQIKQLEDVLGERLFVRQGRRLVLTEVGHVVQRYAEEIFSLGRELVDTVRGRPTGQPERLSIGVADAVPKLLTRMLLEPLRRGGAAVHLILREDRPERLLADLAAHTVDVVVSDAPLPVGSGVKAYSHLLGECGTSFFAASSLDVARRGFPKNLDGAPMVLPTWESPLRRALEEWFARNDVHPKVVAEVEDSALLKTIGEAGWGVFAAPTALAPQIRGQYEVVLLGSTDDVRERFYAITAERRIKNQAVAAIRETARTRLFA
ncbi:MAG: transcriptional activator NhaR [Deltaproteobacteria bacterium]|nr:transcriptional activator NhaR [Deltaproteobacteria bacterium]